MDGPHPYRTWSRSRSVRLPGYDYREHARTTSRSAQYRGADHSMTNVGPRWSAALCENTLSHSDSTLPHIV